MPFSVDEERIIRAKLFGDGVATTADLVAIRGATPSATELGFIDGVSAGIAQVSKALVLGGTKNIDTLRVDVQVLVATGSDNTNGAPITADTAIVTGADDTKAVLLPTAVAGLRVVVVNTEPIKKLKVYPFTGDKINGGTVTTGLVTLPQDSTAIFFAKDATDWYANIVPNGVTATAAELSKLAGTASGLSASELSILDGVTASTAELNILDNCTAAYQDLNSTKGKPFSFTMTPGAGAANICEVAIICKGPDGSTNVARPVPLLVWLSDAATGAGLTGTAASGTVQAKAGSVDLAVLAAKKALIVQTSASGNYTLEITDTAKTAFYVCAQSLDGGPITPTLLATENYGGV